MILQIRNSRVSKFGSVFMMLIFMVTLNPFGSYALTGGPAQPEFNSFTPIGTSDMVDLASGDFSYNIPLMDVGGFPINLAYNSGVTMDQEASWVGLGWDLSIGQINRQMRGLPDDFEGDEVLYENNSKDNWTVGATFQVSPELFGFDPLDINVGISGKYNSYSGYSFSPSAGISYEIAGSATVGIQAESTPDGLVLQPSLSLSNKKSAQDKVDKRVGQTSISASFNSRQGLSNLNLSASTNRPTQNMSKRLKNVSGSSIGSSISLVSNTYTPSVQANMLNLHNTANFAVDGTIFGMKIEAEQTGFGSIQFIDNKTDLRPVYGYEHTEKAPEKAVLDFNREKDGVFSKNSSNLPLTNYTYDVYNVQGQGVAGMFQPYRSQVGYVYDDKMVSNSAGKSVGGEIGGGWTVDVGIDIEANYSRNRTGLWKLTNKVWNNGQGVFEEANYTESPETPDYEEVYFKNAGDLSADPDHGMYDYKGELGGKLGGYNPVRLKFDGLPYARTLQPNYEIKTGFGYANYEIAKNDIKRSERVKRNQVILKVTNKEAKMLKSEAFDVSLYGKDHHTAGFIVTRNDGARYNYGKALYNTQKREVTFALGSPIGGATSSESIGIGNNSSGLVNYVAGVDNSLDNKKGDQYFNRITTPGYGHTFLLTSLVSSDYSDRDDIEGPSVDDFGSYTLFTYRDMGTLYQWRVPYLANKANYNEGLKTDPTDDKGSYVYGEKELTYIKKIETKTHIAIFHISARHDAHGVLDENGGINNAPDMYQLNEIQLFSRAEYENAITTNDDETAANIITDATPIKTVHFEYKYSLCQGVPNNDGLPYDGNGDGVNDNLGGKLTLSKVYFTYRNSGMGKYSAYDFRYGDEDHDWPNSDTDAVDDEDGRNPVYNLKGYDIWGSYKKNTDALTEGAGTNPISPLTAPEFNYVNQNDGNADDYAAAWSLSDISLPSGGQIQVDYETDDYQYVQDKKAMRMFKLVGAGNEPNPSDSDFDFDPSIATSLEGQLDKEALLFKGPNKEIEYLYFKLDKEDQSIMAELADEGADDEELNVLFRNKYLQQIDNEQKGLLQFRILMNMTPKGGVNKSSWKDYPFDYVSGYCELGSLADCKQFKWGDTFYGSVKLKKVEIEGGVGGSLDYVNPISKAGWQFARRYLSQYVYGMPMLEDGTPVGAALESIAHAMENLTESVVGANNVLRGKRIARRFIPEKSWIRLSEPTMHKKGGGCRVKQIAMTDEWEQMSGSEEGTYLGQKYGQEYTYELKDGGSSGVATYEPVGSKENPLVQPVFVNVNRLLAPDDENYIEKPFGESFFPNPQVTYSRVAVKNLERRDGDKKVTKHATGHVVTEFFTSKDYPTITDQTELHLKEDANPLLAAVFSLNVMKHLTLSQGYVIHNNDMNGKMKNQWVYGEGQDEPISGVEYVYDQSTPDDPSSSLGNKGRLDNSVLMLDPNGNVEQGMIGVEQRIINDFREMKSSTQVAGVDFQTNTFTLGPVTLVVPTPFPKYSRHVTRVKIAATTKVISTFGILRETIAHDAGAKVSTRNKLWDSETGEVLLTETVNEYDDHYYSFNFPAHWGYERMGQAAFNNGLVLPLTPLVGGEYSIGVDGDAKDYLALGDEVLLEASVPDGYVRGWVTETDGVNFHLINAQGEALHEETSTQLKIIRSGRRNLQSTSMASIVMQKIPTVLLEHGGILNTNTHLKVDGTVGQTWDDRRIVNAGAVEFRENWDLQCECDIDPLNTTYNPYRYNTLGVWRANKSYLYLTGRVHDADGINPRSDGFYKNYSSFYSNSGGVWIKAPTDWTFTSEVTQYSPYGFELENADALGRYSSAQYGYNFSFPLAVGANSEYSEMGFDGFEDYHFDGCLENEHFGFRDNLTSGDFEPETGIGITRVRSHTGRFSMKITPGNKVDRLFRVDCE